MKSQNSQRGLLVEFFFPPCLFLGSEHFVKDLECTLTHSYTGLNDTTLCCYVNVPNNTFLLKNA